MCKKVKLTFQYELRGYGEGIDLKILYSTENDNVEEAQISEWQKNGESWVRKEIDNGNKN